MDDTPERLKQQIKKVNLSEEQFGPDYETCPWCYKGKGKQGSDVMGWENCKECEGKGKVKVPIYRRLFRELKGKFFLTDYSTDFLEPRLEVVEAQNKKLMEWVRNIQNIRLGSLMQSRQELFDELLKEVEASQ